MTSTGLFQLVSIPSSNIESFLFKDFLTLTFVIIPKLKVTIEIADKQRWKKRIVIANHVPYISHHLVCEELRALFKREVEAICNVTLYSYVGSLNA